MFKDKVLWTAIGIGIAIIAICIILPFCGIPYNNWEIFIAIEAILGFVANLAIFTAAYKYLTKETLYIKGIGKVRISKLQNNIQDLTNLISWKFYDGNNFQRTPVLSAFYKDTSMEIVTHECDYVYVNDLDSSCSFKNKKGVEDSDTSSTLKICRTDVKNIQNLINIVKWVWNDGQDPDNKTLAKIYKGWYNIEQSNIPIESRIDILYLSMPLSLDRTEFESINQLIKVAQCILNNGKEFDKATISDIYRKWYQIN